RTCSMVIPLRRPRAGRVILAGCVRAAAQPHLEYPQLRHVAQPSITTTALVLHLWHIVAEGGKLVPSPVTATSSPLRSAPWSASSAPTGPASAAATPASLFFFERASYWRRFSSISARWEALISGSWIMPIDFR